MIQTDAQYRAENANDDFTMTHYREIVARLVETHRPLSFRDAHELGRGILDIEKFVLMRHDVEFSLHGALRLAEADAEAGIRSTFFLLQTGDYYPFQEEGAELVFKILELGHDIGLHYDAALFERLALDAEAVAQKQIELFELFFSTKVYAMSSHMPMRSGKTFSLPGVVDTYDPLYLREMKYLSDSTQAWREGVVTNVLDRYDQIHLLTHEYIWHPDGFSWDALLLLDAQEKFNSQWERSVANMKLYRQGLRMRQQKDREFQQRYMEQNGQSS